MTLKRALLWLSLLIPLSVYIFTLAPGVFWEDSAAFQAAAYELGIVHNPSFPSYVLLAHLFTRLPMGSAQWLVNLFSAVCAAFSALLVFLMSIRLQRKNDEQSSLFDFSIALAAALGFAFVYGVWVQAIRAEVYAFNLLLVLSVLYITLRFLAAEMLESRFAVLAGIIVGIGLTNHYLIFGAITLPIAVIVLIARRTQLLHWKVVSRFSIFMILGLALYLYLPIREAANPVFNWGDFSSVAASLRSILRLDESPPIDQLTTTTPFLARLVSVASETWSSIPLVIWGFAVVGIFSILNRERTIGLTLVLLTGSSVLITAYAAEFSRYNLDLYGYLMPAFAGCFAFAAIGAGSVVRFARANIKTEHRALRGTVLAVIVIALFGKVGFIAATNFNVADKSALATPDEYAVGILETLKPKSIFLAGEDNSYSPLLCKQVIDGTRRDVAVISAGALLRSDYRKKVEARWGCYWYPDNWNDRSFAEDFPTNLATWISHNSDSYQVAMTLSQWTSQLIPNLHPNGFCFVYSDSIKLTQEVAAQSVLFYRDHEPMWKGSSDITTGEHFGRLLYNLAVYYNKHNQPALAAKYSRDAVAADSMNLDLLLGCLKMAILTHQSDEQTRLATQIEELDPGNEKLAGILKAALAVSQGDTHGS